ncbi:hypothetical protein Pmani_008067 [Petrolisthes manimaculis]|uniref:Exonuclease domain-containing protein n=1 Tax=Petrolisthes manimaculis TaxID=1843537 RepID=A0AAE1UEZ9_9EUCA|nr:hypothetical protein Pmani_008067 [Petrolisthes manimaculis]
MFFIFLVVGGTVFLLLWLIRQSKQQSTKVIEKAPQKKKPQTSSNKSNQKKKQPAPSSKLQQKPNSSQYQHQFSHPELITSLKGHCGPLTSGGFSANGKHFVSTAEVVRGRRFDPGGRSFMEVSDDVEARFITLVDTGCRDGMEEIDTSSVSSGSHVTTSNNPSDTEDSYSSASKTPHRRHFKMSRRQRRNKNKKGKVSQELSQLEPSSPSEAQSETTRELFDILGKTEKQLYDLLLPLCSGVEDRVLNGYPYVTNQGVYVFKAMGYSTLAGVLSGGFQLSDAEIKVKRQPELRSILDIEDGHSDYSSESESLEDMRTNNCDHDNQDASSGISSDGKECEDEDNISELNNETESFNMDNIRYYNYQLIERCRRCKQNFNVNENGSRSCEYHPKKVIMRKDGQLRFQCCNKLKGVQGCTKTLMHVYHHLRAGLNGPLRGYVTTKSGRERIVGLDCEMVYTTEGFELARITLVRMTGKVLLDLYVQPRGSVFDYNTQFSGITAEHMQQAETFTKARERVLSFIGSSTILIGHSLEGDLAALKIIHRLVIDTSLMFGVTKNSFTLKQSLKTLAKKLLSRDIQKGGSTGHDSLEDATAAVDLVLNHFVESHKVRKIAPLPLALQNVA